MNVNIVQLITSQLGGGTINKLSSFLGESPEHTQSAVGAAVPTLLAGLTHVASTPEGAQRLSSAVSQQDPNITSNFDSSLATGSAAGSSTLNNLFGGGMVGSLTSVLGRFTGMKTTAVSGLLGSIAPLTLGVLGKQQKAMGLDSSGLAGFLNGQKQNIASAMPSGLANVLGSVPGFSSFAPKVPAEEIAHAGAAPSFSGTTSGSGRSAAQVEPEMQRKPGSSVSWIVTLLVAAAIVLGLWSWSHRQATQPVTEQLGTTMVNSTAQISSGLQDSLASATTTLSGITNSSTADQALPQLTQLNNKIGTLRAQADKLPASAKSTALNSLQPTIAKLQQLSAKVRGTPGVSDKFQTTLNQFDANLSDLKTNTNP